MDRVMDHPVTSTIRKRVWEEIDKMGTDLDIPLIAHPLREILVAMDMNLLQITRLLKNREIDPSAELRTCEEELPKSPRTMPLRIGIYPVAANPFHWAHLIIGLTAIARFQLDKVIYLIAGSDPRKPELLPAGIRHTMGKEVLKICAPLFAYSAIALGSMADGETNAFRILQLNPHQEISAFYIAGGDHYHHINPETKRPDTLKKLEDKIAGKSYGFDRRSHRISAVFIDRGMTQRRRETPLSVYFLPPLPFEASSSAIRQGFREEGESQPLTILPYTAYRFIITFGLYGSKTGSRKDSTLHVLDGPDGMAMSDYHSIQAPLWAANVAG
jgi:nicotinate-nucleotide adenylyltransferase